MDAWERGLIQSPAKGPTLETGSASSNLALTAIKLLADLLVVETVSYDVFISVVCNLYNHFDNLIAYNGATKDLMP